jgi:2-polyprenyl-3-methyl-5-hydroxy-6-metoxy-1,4-benzoquinol methylase
MIAGHTPMTESDRTIQLPSVTHQDELRRGERFEFGRNWTRFLSGVNDQHIAAAEGYLRSMLRVDDLVGKSFLDIGSGSGLSSLAARRLGARVHSFDYDPRSVACTRELRRRFFRTDASWSVDEGSALDRAYLESLGQFDVVYSWGVLHHTGAMWTALDHAAIPVRTGGTLFIAIYNDQGGLSRRWRAVKKLYCSSPLGKATVCAIAIPWFAGRRFVIDCLKGDNPAMFYRKYKERRGMSPLHDWFDWLGGYPFEVARPEQIFRFYRDKGFALANLTTKGALAGCNEFIFVRET